MNVLITGGNGFIAQHLKRYLDSDYTVYALGKDQFNCLDNSAVSLFFDQHNIDVVIHTALTGREDLFSTDPQYLVDGLLMWRNLYDNRHKFKKLIQFGTVYELDLNKNNSHTTVKDILQTSSNSSYGYAKNIISRICLETENFYNLRVFGNFHYTEKDTRFFKKLLHSTEFVINEDRLFDYVNLEDILKVVKFIITESPAEKDINMVYNNKLLLSEHANLFSFVNKINPKIIVNGQGYELTADGSTVASFNLIFDGLEKGFNLYRKSL